MGRRHRGPAARSRAPALACRGIRIPQAPAIRVASLSQSLPGLSKPAAAKKDEFSARDVSAALVVGARRRPHRLQSGMKSGAAQPALRRHG